MPSIGDRQKLRSNIVRPMKTVLCCIIFNSILVCSVAAEEPPLQLRITNVGSLIGVSRDDREVLEDQLHVVVMNSSTEEIRIYDQWNSWGYGSLTLSLDFEDTKEKKELTRFGGLQWTANSRGEICLLYTSRRAKCTSSPSSLWTSYPLHLRRRA